MPARRRPEVAGQDAIEGVVRERQRECIAHDGEARGQASLGDRCHGGAGIQPDDEAAEVTGQEAGAAGDVERAGGGQGRDERDDAFELGVPAGAVACGERPLALVPLVVLAGAAVVVRVRARVAGEAHAALGSLRLTTLETPSSLMETP